MYCTVVYIVVIFILGLKSIPSNVCSVSAEFKAKVKVLNDMLMLESTADSVCLLVMRQESFSVFAQSCVFSFYFKNFMCCALCAD